MKFDIGGNPDYGDLTVVLQPGESIWAESGAMSRMSSHLSMKSHIIGGTMQGLFRKVLGGQSLFVGEYTASQMGFIALSPAFPGSILHRQIDAESLWLTAGSFLACSPGMHIRPKFAGMKAIFSGEGIVLLQVSGAGDLFFGAFARWSNETSMESSPSIQATLSAGNRRWITPSEAWAA